MDIAIWNVLHDGCLVGVEGVVPGDFLLSVDIEYLCEHLPTQANHLVVILTGCQQFEYHPYEEEVPTSPSGIAALELALLSAWELEGTVRVACSDGGAGAELVLRYASVRVVTAEGRPLTQAEMVSAAKRYWSLRKEQSG